jgi:tetratricopeptide (TPR) repeat protein/predicted Ser/Thr protein kinase
MEDCVETEELVAMLDGKLASDRLEAVLVHVDRCKLCAEVIATLARDTASRCVGRYQLGRVIGSGGMGVVHEGWDPELRRRVAVKLVRPERSDDASRARMLREARALARISHPNVVAVYDVGEHDGEIYVATELVDGETMATWCDGRSAREIIGAWIQAGRGLEAAHAGGIVHRDVKPANVLVGRDGRVRIGDFGLARLGEIEAAPPTLVEVPMAPSGTPVTPGTPVAPVTRSDPAFYATVTGPGRIAGTPAYMAPEQWVGAGDARSDQYALSVAIIESLTGKRPGDDRAFTLPAGTPGGEALARALDRGLRADPEARFPSIGAFADALADAIAPPVRRSRAALVAAVAAVTVGLGAAVAWGVARRGELACRAAEVPADLWSPERRAGVEKKLAPVIATHVDGWMTAWAAAAADVCAIDGGAPVLRSRRQRCLDDALDESRKMLGRWDADPRHGVYFAQLDIELLPRPAGCSHAAAAAAIEPTQAQAFAITALRGRMDLTLHVLKRDELAVVREVADGARSVGHVPFMVETAIELAKQLVKEDRTAATAVLRDAIARADQIDDDRSRAQATIALLAMLDADRADDAVTLAGAARAGLARLGGDPALECDLDFALGDVLRAAQRYDEAIAALERARRNAHDAYGPDTDHEAKVLVALDTAYTRGDLSSTAPGGKPARDAAAAISRTIGLPVKTLADTPTLSSMIETLEGAVELQQRMAPRSEDEAVARWALANAYYVAGRHDRALEQYRQAAALYDQLKIRNSPALDTHAHIALALLDAGELHEALREATRAADMANAIAVKSDIGFTLTIQGQVRIALGDIAGARNVLKRALDVRMEIRAGPTQIGQTQFQYARTLWKVDRRLAVDYATSARVQIRSYLDSEVPEMEQPYILPVQKRRLAEINRWLDEHKL